MLLFPSSRGRAVQNNPCTPCGVHSPPFDLTPSVAKKRSTRGYIPRSPPGWPRRRRARTLAPGTRFLRTRGKRFHRKTAPRRRCEDWIPCSACVSECSAFLSWTGLPPDEGWLRDQKKLRSYLCRADGVLKNISDHPVRPIKGCLRRYFLLRSRHPSSGGGA